MSIGIDATYAHIMLGRTNMKLYDIIMPIQLHLPIPRVRKTPFSQVFVSTEIRSKL